MFVPHHQSLFKRQKYMKSVGQKLKIIKEIKERLKLISDACLHEYISESGKHSIDVNRKIIHELLEIL